MNIQCEYFSLQEIGKRSNQEDSIYPRLGNFISNNNLFILCDGMGGYECGEVASQVVCESISRFMTSYPDAFFERALCAAYDALDAVAGFKNQNMGTTLAYVQFKDNSCLVAHIGDSRVYHIRPSEKRIVFVTNDHSLINDLIACGELTPEEAKSSSQKNIITRAMQPRQIKRTKADIAVLTDIKVGDFFYMCSDGMLEMCKDEDIVTVLSMPVHDEQKLELLRSMTQDNDDNHSAHLIHITDMAKSTDDVK